MGPGPADGTYLIRSISTKYYLAGTGAVRDNVPLSLTDPARFIVTAESPGTGMYYIKLQSNSDLNLSVGLTPPGRAGDALRWQRNPYVWNITTKSPGVWSIQVPGDTLYWFDGNNRPLYIFLEPESVGDPNIWEFVAAA